MVSVSILEPQNVGLWKDELNVAGKFYNWKDLGY